MLTRMGRRQKIKKKIDGHRRHIDEHRRKIDEERAKPNPNENLIELWRKQIANAERQIEKLQRRMERRSD